MAAPEGFEFEEHGNGDVTVRHHGSVAARLRGDRATRFLIDVKAGDAQLVMAKVTGNYRRGNERSARQHPRNLGR
jgi:hypothetical protein